MATNKNENESGVRSGTGLSGVNPGDVASGGKALDQGAGTKTDDGWRKNFPQADAAGAAREDYQKTADQRRAEAQLAANLERARQAEVEGEPVPTGEGENPHEGEPQVDENDPNASKPQGQ